MEDRPRLATRLEGAPDLQRAPGIGGGDRLGTGVEQRLRLASAELRGGLRLEQVVDAGRPAADLPAVGLDQLHPRDPAQERARLGPNALRVREMARIVV